MPRTKKLMSIWVSKELAEKIEELASQQRRKKSAQVELLLEKALELEKQ